MGQSNAGFGSAAAMGLVALLVGLVAILLCWIPFVGFISYILAVLGLLMAFIGFCSWFSARDCGMPFIVAGFVLNGGLLALPLLAAIGILVAGGVVVDSLADSAAANAKESEPAAPVVLPPPTVDIGDTFTLDDKLMVRVVDVWVCPAEILSLGAPMTTSRPYLHVRLSVTNGSARPVEYRSWSSSASIAAGSLTCRAGSEAVAVAQLAGGDRFTMGLQDRPVTLGTGERVDDLIILDAAASRGQDLLLSFRRPGEGERVVAYVRVPRYAVGDGPSVPLGQP